MTLSRLAPATLNFTKLFAFALMAVGIVAFAYRGISYTNTQKDTAPLPPVVSVIAWASGLAVLALDRKRRGAGTTRRAA